MRIARLGWPLGRLSCWGLNRVREVGRPVSPSLIVFLFSSSASSFLPPTLVGRPSRFYFVCAPRVALSLSLSHSLFLGLSLLSLFRRAKMVHGRSRAPISPRILRAEDRPLLLYIPAPLPVLPLYSPRFFAPARSVVAASRFFFAVFPFFMHAIASFALLTRRNGISVFYRLDYYHLLAAFFLLSANTPSPPPPCPALPWSLPRSEFRYFIMDGGTVERPNNMGAVYHESRKSYFEAQ